MLPVIPATIESFGAPSFLINACKTPDNIKFIPDNNIIFRYSSESPNICCEAPNIIAIFFEKI